MSATLLTSTDTPTNHTTRNLAPLEQTNTAALIIRRQMQDVSSATLLASKLIRQTACAPSVTTRPSAPTMMEDVLPALISMCAAPNAAPIAAPIAAVHTMCDMDLFDGSFGTFRTSYLTCAVIWHNLFSLVGLFTFETLFDASNCV